MIWSAALRGTNGRACAARNWGDDIHIKLNGLDRANILHAVRNILLDWTLAMEKLGMGNYVLDVEPEMG